ncbi:hypothetical protein LTR84_007852 [Exophiala bonariae]|uniref:NmrA-like domain-containing protein n=1 Tax=Exophiala bonariae TaxID=1690606 RepID=A0AAV9NQ10_9EURO|nr:hypothetical protein LTR84_007852 [Exophiala bonariae]
MASTTGTKVAVVGPNGTLGQVVVKELLKLGYSITLVTRDASKTRQGFTSNDQITIVEVDFSSTEGLTEALRDHQSVVSLINRDQPDAQIKVIDAALEAGVEQIIPSCFGLDTRVPEVHGNPSVATKAKMEDYLFSKIPSSDTKTTYTAIMTGLFLDWALGIGMIVNAVGKGDKPTMFFDDGEAKLSMTHREDIGKAVASAVEHRNDDRFKNKRLLIHTIAATQNEFIAYAKELAPEKPWPMFKIDTAEAARKSQEALDKGDTSADAVRGFLMKMSFGDRLGFFSEVDNDLLGVKEQDGAYLKKLLSGFLQGQ